MTGSDGRSSGSGHVRSVAAWRRRRRPGRSPRRRRPVSRQLSVQLPPTAGRLRSHRERRRPHRLVAAAGLTLVAAAAGAGAGFVAGRTADDPPAATNAPARSRADGDRPRDRSDRRRRRRRPGSSRRSCRSRRASYPAPGPFPGRPWAGKRGRARLRRSHPDQRPLRRRTRTTVTVTVNGEDRSGHGCSVGFRLRHRRQLSPARRSDRGRAGDVRLR